PVIVTKTEDPRELEGEIVRVDYPRSQMVIRDIDGRERKVIVKQGMINNYKVDDYVKVYLMADMKEAKSITTKRTADIEGEVVGIDYARNQIVVRDRDGADRAVFAR